MRRGREGHLPSEGRERGSAKCARVQGGAVQGCRPWVWCGAARGPRPSEGGVKTSCHLMSAPNDAPVSGRQGAEPPASVGRGALPARGSPRAAARLRAGAGSGGGGEGVKLVCAGVAEVAYAGRGGAGGQGVGGAVGWSGGSRGAAAPGGGAGSMLMW